MAKFTIDTDKLAELLKGDKPISMGAFDDKDGKPKVIAIFALPELESKLREFVEEILNSPLPRG